MSELREITPEQLKQTLELHKKWLFHEEEGVRADLSNYNLRRADLSDADLIRANLSDADLDLQVKEGLLLEVAKVALASDEALEMSEWHSSCGTAHCIAGWAVTLAGKEGEKLEGRFGTAIVGLKLLGVEAYGHFHDGNKKGREYLQSILDANSQSTDSAIEPQT